MAKNTSGRPPAGRPTKKELQGEVDRVLASDGSFPRRDQQTIESPHRPQAAGLQPVPPIGSLGASGGSSPVAPIQPVSKPVPGSRPDMSPRDTLESTFGVSGTPITSAFLLDLGEYNAQLVGRTAVPVWEKMRRGDDMVAALLSVWRLPVMTAKWDVAEPDLSQQQSGAAVSSNGAGRATQKKAKEITQFVRDNLFGGLEFSTSSGSWVSQSWQDVIYHATLMLDFGCSIHEDIFTVDGDKLRLRNLPHRQALTFYRWPVEDDGETLISLEQYGYRGSQFLNVTLPVERMCRFTYRQEGANFFGIPLTRGMYNPWFYKDRIKRIAGIAAEKNSVGVPTYRLGQGFDPKEKTEAQELMQAIAAHERMYIVEPPPPAAPTLDAKFGFRFESPKGTGEVLRGLLQWVTYYDISMGRAAIAMFISSGNTPFGSRSTTKEHADFFLLAVQSLADQIRWEIQNSTLRRLVWYNFGQDAPMPELTAANVQARQLEDMVALLKDLGMAGMAVSDQPLRDWLRKEIAAPKETRDGLVAVRGETIDMGSGGDVSGKAGGQIIDPNQPMAPATAATRRGEQQQMRDSTLYHLLPDDEKIRLLETGDDFRLTRPVLFGDAEKDRWAFADTQTRGPVLVIKGTLSSNEWLKGKFRVVERNGSGDIIATHISQDA
jgi:hypothetical protein